jgi:hypothetical protein
MEIAILTEQNIPQTLQLLSNVEPSVAILLQSPTQYCSALKLTSELDSWQSVSPKLYEIEKKGQKSSVALLVILINDLADCLNIGKNMSAQQVIDCAQIVFDEFSQLKLNDVVLCFNKIKRGHYGVIYDRLDVHVIMEKLHRFCADQDEQIEYHRQREGQALKRIEKQPLTPTDPQHIFYGPVVKRPAGCGQFQGPRVPPPDYAIDWIKKIRQDLVKPKPSPKPVDKRMISTTDAEIQSWLRQFKEKTEDCTGVRFLQRNGQMMDATAFLNHKQYQKSLLVKRNG